jgi:hypothetical protein
MTSAPDRLRDAAALFEERSAVYGSDYLDSGALMKALFGDALSGSPLTEAEHARVMMACRMAMKLARYCRNVRRGGHADSLADLSVYAAMTAELDQIAADQGVA